MLPPRHELLKRYILNKVVKKLKESGESTYEQVAIYLPAQFVYTDKGSNSKLVEKNIRSRA